MIRYLLPLLLIGCATVRAEVSPDYDNPGPCPSELTDQQKLSGYIQCRAQCASDARNVVKYDDQCRCICTPKIGTGTSPYTPNPQI